MLSEDKYFRDLTEAELWQRYCGFLDLSIDEFMGMQKELLMDQIELVSVSILGKKIMNNQIPKSVEEFRQTVPITTYDDYEPYFSDQQDSVLAIKPIHWCHSSGRGGRFKWFPDNSEAIETLFKSFIATMILATTDKKGRVNINPGLRFLTVWPPPPYASGARGRLAKQYFSCRIMPPLETSEGKAYSETIKEGFMMALKDGTDIVISISSVLAKMGEAFAEQMSKRRLSKSMLHIKIILRFLQAQLRAKRNKRLVLPKDIWAPKAVLCSGVDTNIYKDEIQYYWGCQPFDFYASTETYFAATQAWNKKAMTFFPHSVFLEFLPYKKTPPEHNGKDCQPSTLLINEVEEGKLYELVITQFYGQPLLRYRLGDIVKVISLEDKETGVKLPQIIVQGKVSEIINLANLASLDEKTIWQAIANTKVKYEDWTAFKEYDQKRSFLHILIELKKEGGNAPELASMIDEQLKTVDTDYKDIASYLKEQPVRVTFLSPGTFQRYTEEKTKEGAKLSNLKPFHINPSEESIGRLLKLSKMTR